MITIKKLRISERQILSSINKFIYKHTIISYIFISIFVVFSVITLFSMLTLAAPGAGCIMNSAYEKVQIGEMSVYEYNVLMNIMDIEAAFYNYLEFLGKLALGILLAIPIYMVYKEYLKYKHDNL